MPDILVVDDEPAVIALVKGAVAKMDGYQVTTASTAQEARNQLADRYFDVAVFDVLLPDESGLELMPTVRELDARLPVIYITGGGTAGTAIEAMKAGAFDYLAKPLDIGRLKKMIAHAAEVRRLMTDPVGVAHTEADAASDQDLLVGRSSAMTEVYKAIGRVAPKNVTVLIRGESGTGKELVARSVYQHSHRSEQPFLAVNCAAIPESLLESELFGHEKGAFTGADRRRIGKFEQCSGGTLFLDEIGDMPLALQGKILRLLQDQRFERVGGNETIQTDVRIITATHRDLESMSEAGTFRADLYYRLNVFEIQIPPLRERIYDLPPLIGHFLRRASVELEKDVTDIANATMDLLREYSWPGNVRELQSVLKKAVLNASGPVLLPEFLPEPWKSAGLVEQTVSLEAPAVAHDGWDQFLTAQLEVGTETLYDDAVVRLERWLITRILQHTSGNQVQAASMLGVTRTTLRSKLTRLGISIEKVVDQGGE